MNAWNWFLAHGDKLLTALATVAMYPGLLPPWVAPVLGALATAHLVVLPEPSATPASGNISNIAKVLLPFALVVLLVGTAGGLTACKTTPTQNQQAGIAVAVDIATGFAVQNGSNDPGVWKAKAAQFKAIAVTLQQINAAGPASLATLSADLQPLIAKLGPADVLAANALVAAITPYLQQQLGTNPTVANTQAAVGVILQDIVNACAAYGA